MSRLRHAASIGGFRRVGRTIAVVPGLCAAYYDERALQGRAQRAAGGPVCRKGNQTRNLLPLPGSLSTSIRPWWFSTIR